MSVLGVEDTKLSAKKLILKSFLTGVNWDLEGEDLWLDIFKAPKTADNTGSLSRFYKDTTWNFIQGAGRTKDQIKANIQEILRDGSDESKQVVTQDKCICILLTLSDFQKQRPGCETLSRLDFCTHICPRDTETDKLCLIDLAFHLFPENENTYMSTIPNRLHLALRSPIRYPFIASYVQEMVAGSADLRDLFVCFVLVTLYAIVSTQDRGIAPRGFMGRGIVKGLSAALDSQQFPGCTRNPTTNGSWSLTCDSEDMVFGDVATVDDVYAFIKGGLSNLFWQGNNNATAGTSKIANGLRVVGALKIRTQHAKARPIHYLSSFFEPVYALEASRYPPGDLRTAPLPIANSFIQSHVLMPWDGSRFGNCAELNATGSVPGLNSQVTCEGHAVVFPFNNTRLNFQGVIEELAASDWISNSTRNVVVDTILFHLDSTMFISLQLLFEIQAGGTVTLARYVTPFKFRDNLEVGSSAIMYTFFAFSLISLGVVLCRFITKKFGGKIDQLEVPGLLDIGFVLMLIIPVSLRLSWIVAIDASSSDPLWQLDHYPHDYEYIATLFSRSITADGFVAVFSVLLLVRFARYTARCAPVVNALGRSLSLGVVLVVLASALLFAFAVSATAIFGDRQLGFQTIQTSLASLMLGFIGSFDFKPLIEENYAAAFIFFATFMLLVIIVFLSMFVAVFTDSFDDEQSDAFRAVRLKHILASNPNHALTGSPGFMWLFRTFLVHCELTTKEVIWRSTGFVVSHLPFKSKPSGDLAIPMIPIKESHSQDAPMSSKRRDQILEDRYSYLNYNRAVASDLLAVIQPKEFFQNKISHETRIEATACLLLLLGNSEIAEQNVDTLLSSASAAQASSASNSTSLNAYIQDLFGEYDHDLIMSLLVMIPQERFGIPGVPALEHAARKWQPWHSKISRKVLTVKKKDITELHLGVVTHRLSQISQSNVSDKEHAADDIADLNTQVNEPTFITVKKNFKSLCEALPPLNRRIFLGVLACGSDEDYGSKSEKEIDRELFQNILEREAPLKEAYDSSSVSLWHTLGIEHWRDSRCTCKYAPDDCTCILTRLLMNDAVPYIMKEFGIQCYGMKLSFSLKQQLLSSHENSAHGKSSQGATSWTAEEFTTLWQKTFLKHDGPPTTMERLFRHNASPPARVTQLFPNRNTVNCNDFWKYCCEDPNAEQRRGFPQVFANHMSKASVFLAWVSYIISLIIFVSVVILYGGNTVDNVHVSNALRMALAPSEDSEAHHLDHVRDYLGNVVSNVWRGGPTDTAKPLQDVNYFIGALRIRQVRVKSRPQQTCNDLFDEYFGASLDPSPQDFYQIRVQRDFESLLSGRCYGAYDSGDEEDTSTMPIQSFPFAFLDLGRVYRTADSEPSRAHDTTYNANGYYVDIPYNSTSTEAASFIDVLLSSNWLDQQTRLVVVEFAVYNLNLHVYRHAQFGYEVTSGGAMYPLKQLITLNIVNDSFSTTTLRVTSVCYTILVLWYLYLLFGQGQGSVTPIKLVKKWWDLSMLCMLIVSWIWTYTLVWGGVESLHNDGVYPNEIRSKGASAKDKAILESVLLFLLVLRLLVVLCINRNVRLVFDTFHQAFNDLFVILVLFILCLVAFSVGALLLFGYYFDGQYNFQNNFFDFLNTVSGGDSSYQDLSTLRPEVSLIFFIIFVITCLFVLFNMVTAVLTGAFREVKDRLYDPKASEEVLKRSPFHSTNDFLLILGRRPMGIEIIQKCKWVWRMTTRKRGFTLAKRHEAGGSYWRQQARWWANVDTQPPIRAAVAGIKLLMLHEQVDQYRADKHMLRRRDTDELITAGAVKTIPELKRRRDEDIIRSGDFDFFQDLLLNFCFGQAVFQWLHAFAINNDLPVTVDDFKNEMEKVEDDFHDRMMKMSPNQLESETIRKWFSKCLRLERLKNPTFPANQSEERYHSYGLHRRLPLWDEYLYSQFQEDFFQVQMYCVGDPARLLGIEPDSMWLQALSARHYYNIRRQLRNIDLEETQGDTKDPITTIVQYCEKKVLELSFDHESVCNVWSRVLDYITNILPVHQMPAPYSNVFIRDGLPYFMWFPQIKERCVIAIIPPHGQMQVLETYMKKQTSVFHITPAEGVGSIIFGEVISNVIGDIYYRLQDILEYDVVQDQDIHEFNGVDLNDI